MNCSQYDRCAFMAMTPGRLDREAALLDAELDDADSEAEREVIRSQFRELWCVIRDRGGGIAPASVPVLDVGG